MDIINKKEFIAYIQSNYEKIYEMEGEWQEFQQEYDGFCDSCQRDVFLRIRSRRYQHYGYNSEGIPTFLIYLIECPRCNGKRFNQPVLLEVKTTTNKTGQIVDLENEEDFDEEDYSTKTHYELYQLYSIPTKEESFVNKDIPDIYSTLKKSVSEAMFGMTHGKYISSAIMFRRALQIIAKDILGAKGKTLYNQLEWLITNENALKVDLTNLFHDNSKLIKDVGNQGAHLDQDITLQDFTQNDVNNLHDLFLVIVNEIFIKPTKLKAIQEDLIKNRKIKN